MNNKNSKDIDVTEKLYKKVSANTIASSIALIINLIVISIAFYELQPLPFLIAWVLFILILLFLRNIDAYLYIHKQTYTPTVILAKRFKIYSILIAISVSSGIFYLTPHDLPFHQAFLAMIVAGLSAGAVMALSFYQNLTRAYIIILVFPFASLMFIQGHTINILISLLMFLFVFMLIMFSKRFYDTIYELIISQHELSKKAHYDNLTGLANRATLYDRLSLEISKVKRHNNSAVLLFIDLDNFKNINDSYGHHVGDEILKIFSASMQTLIRDEDTFARVGGDEFIILLSNLSANTDEVTEVVQKLSDKIHTKLNEPLNIDSNLFELSVSIGIEIISAHNLDINAVIKNADTAMYKAKENGKSQTSFFQQ